MPQPWNYLVPIATVVALLLTPILAWWGTTRFFAGQFGEWRVNSELWRVELGRRLDVIDNLLRVMGYEALRERVDNLAEDVAGLRAWKHEKVDPYIPGAIDALKERVDYIQERFDQLRRSP